MPKETKKAAAKKAEPSTPRFYPGDDLPAPKAKQPQNPAKLRSSLVPGTVVILLSGHFRGKRAIFLKQLSSGLLLVTGPYDVNGVPMKRVNQSYVIATSTKVSLPKLPMEVDDAYFVDAKKADEAAREAKGSGEDKFFAEKKTKTEVSEQRKKDQAAFDKALKPAVEKTEHLTAYLQAKFGLKKGDKPHEMKF